MVSDVANVEYESDLIKEDSECLNDYDKEKKEVCRVYVVLNV